VEAHWRETIVGERGELVLEGLPFDPGQVVEEPLEPVAGEEWDALQ
jgi:hypothetical protein